MGGLGATILLLGGFKHPFTLLLDLSCAPLVAPCSLWAPFGTHYGSSERTSRCARIPSKVWVLAHLGTARMPLYSSGGSLAPSRPPGGLSGTRLTLLWAPAALSWSAQGAIWCVFDLSRFRSCFCAPGKGAQRGFRTCRRMFRKGSQSPTRLTFETPLGSPGTQNRDQESLSQAERAASCAREPQGNAKSCLKAPQRTLEKREMETQYSRSKTLPQEGKCK